ncbi:hypothetical protein [Sulfitobacter sp. S190]|uniref:hypothetical protein n=1 Tax=Sulfitobacter sp. S190 TaxID=2867022 RepID=UPI0021A3D7E8|nr:hypothetical protein [Sulfitobacter sp. S190]UWR22731.1 hypothetical protein K3756_01655 [Sulfitobacter sp. S190]
MTDATCSAPPIPYRIATTRPERPPVGMPVFISDCATPLAGETLLSLLLRRMGDRDLRDQ